MHMMTTLPCQEPALRALPELPEPALRALHDIVGPAWVFDRLTDRLAYCRDRLPWGTYRLREGWLPASLPSAVVMPGDAEELRRLVLCANALGLALIPFGAGSGVLGGAVPLGREVMVDLKRLNRLRHLDETDGTVTVEAGMNGAQFEDALRARGWTCGHLPQSIAMSTVGGWASCRGAGQASSRYGKIEDMVLGLRGVLPDGRPVEVRPVARRSVGPSIKDLLVGAEGTLGFITELTLRVWRQPAFEQGVVLAFPDHEAGLQALRRIMQAELRPQVARLYDEEESRARTQDVAGFDSRRPVLCILKFSGLERLARLEAELACDIAAECGAAPAGHEPLQHWEQTRYQSYSTRWQTDGHHMDTIEITGPWSRLPQMYHRMRAAVLGLAPGAFFGAHWSHVYPEGACQYMTLRLPPMEHARALDLHGQAWAQVQSLCLELGGSVAHHHGAGWFRTPWLREELGTGHALLQALKDAVDPRNVCNPGKLGLRAREVA